MIRRRNVGLAFAIFAACGASATAQTPPNNPPTPAASDVKLRPIDPDYSPRPARRPPTYSRTTAYPESRRDRGDSDNTYGFRNPGGVGRIGEYYPPGNKFQSPGDPIRVATFNGTSGPPGVQEQMQAQQLGVAKTNALNNQIDALARPNFGFGYGFGYGGAFGATFPY